MRIEHANEHYKLEFQRIWEFTTEELPRQHLSDPVKFKPKGTITEARLLRWYVQGQGEISISGWIPVAAATARSWRSRSGKHVDTFSKEEGRRTALAKMVKKLPRTLGGVVMQAYYNRPHDPDPQGLRRQIAALELELERLEARQTPRLP